MENERFDGLIRKLGAGTTRRGALAQLAAAVGLGHGGAEARKRRKGRKTRKRGKPKAAATGAAVAAEATCASPGPSSNLNGCNFNNREFAGIDLSSSSMRGTRFRGADLCGADLSSSNLKDADFRGFAPGSGSGRPTTLFRADLSSSGCNETRFNNRTLFCRTRTCNGSVSDRDCPAGVDPDAVCCADDECAAERVCRDGACVPTCDVCPSGCRYDSVADAVADPDGPTTIRICRGRYPESVVIAKDVTLVGAGASQDPAFGTVLDGDQRQVLRIESGATVTLRRLTVSDGRAEDGGCIDNRGSLTLVEAEVSACTAINSGGGIANSGTLILDRTTVANCSANAGGGIANNGGDVTLDRATVADCVASGGGGIANGGGVLTLDDANVTGCEAISAGGGIVNQTGGTVNLKGATLVSLNSVGEIGEDHRGQGLRNFEGQVACEGAPRVCSNPHGGTATRLTNCEGVSAASCGGVCLGDRDLTPGSGACPV